MFSSEKELAKCVVDWLKDHGHEIWQEVQLYRSSSVHDIVAVKEKVIWVIECKLSLSLSVIGQAESCKFAHKKSIAIPDRRHGANRIASRFGQMVCKKFGIGILRVSPQDIYGSDPILTEDIFPSTDHVLETLSAIPKDFSKAGSAGGGHYTAYKGTMQKVKEIIQNSPGCTMKEIMQVLDGKHHYASAASARSCICSALQSFEKKWCKWEMKNNVLRFYVD